MGSNSFMASMSARLGLSEGEFPRQVDFDQELLHLSLIISTASCDVSSEFKFEWDESYSLAQNYLSNACNAECRCKLEHMSTNTGPDNLSPLLDCEK